MIYRRLTSDKTATLKNSGTIRTLSIVMAVLGVLTIFTTITSPDLETSSVFILVCFFIVPSVLLYRLHLRMKADGERYKRYISIIVNQEERLIASIASGAGVDATLVTADLEKMITLGYFKDAYIDFKNGMIVLPNIKTNLQIEEEEEARRLENTEFKVVFCPSCGANGKVEVGKVGVCEYCDSYIQ